VRSLSGALTTGRHSRRVGALGLVVAGAAILAGCGGSSAGVLTNSSLPANLPLKLNNSNVSKNLAKVFNKTYPGCSGTYAVFTQAGRAPTPVLSGKKIYPQVFSESASCPSTEKAHTVFLGVVKKVKTFGATSLSGIGDGAILATSKTAKANSFVIFWQDGPVLASVQLSGSTSDKRISLAETKELAHRQIAHNS
jgi:hypothetical protein